MVQMSPNFLTFPIYLWQTLPYPFGASKWKKMGFLEHFCCRQYQFLDHKIWFFSFFYAKMTKISIQRTKLIVPNDNQQFSVVFIAFSNLWYKIAIKPNKDIWTRLYHYNMIAVICCITRETNNKLHSWLELFLII